MNGERMGTHLNDAFGADRAVVRASRLREETFRAVAAGEVGAGRSVAGIAEGSVEIVEQHVLLAGCGFRLPLLSLLLFYVRLAGCVLCVR